MYKQIKTSVVAVLENFSQIRPVATLADDCGSRCHIWIDDGCYRVGIENCITSSKGKEYLVVPTTYIFWEAFDVLRTLPDLKSNKFKRDFATLISDYMEMGSSVNDIKDTIDKVMKQVKMDDETSTIVNDKTNKQPKEIANMESDLNEPASCVQLSPPPCSVFFDIEEVYKHNWSGRSILQATVSERMYESIQKALTGMKDDEGEIHIQFINQTIGNQVATGFADGWFLLVLPNVKAQPQAEHNKQPKEKL